MKTALINLDMINEICHPKGKLAKYSDRISKSHTLANINDLNSWGRKQGHLIIHVRLGFSSHYLDCSTISPIFSAAETNHAVAITECASDEEQMASLNFLSRIAAIRTTKELIL